MGTDDRQRIIIMGGGTAGWMAAAAMGRFFSPKNYEITLIESESIGTVGVGEATIPHIRQFNEMLGINENEFIRATNATYKLGISFENWGRLGERYMHPFGSSGRVIQGIDFHHYWLALKKREAVSPYDSYSMAVVAARNSKFDYPSESENSVSSTYSYAFHIDAGLYARFLRSYAEKNGVVRVEGIVGKVVQDGDTNDIKELITTDGRSLCADLFIDCSGFRSLLLGNALRVPFDDWSHWLPCDRAVAIPSENNAPPVPFTRAIAMSAGWQWRIPLQHRRGNGYVYSSAFIKDDSAAESLIENIGGNGLANPNFIQFKAGRRLTSWSNNCVAIGLSSGFLEPLESTSIYLIQLGILTLLEYFPDKQVDPRLREEFNRIMEGEYLKIRDFLILHYSATKRSDSPFWNYCRNMSIPDELNRKIELFKATAHIEKYEKGLFMAPSWLSVYLGQGIIPSKQDIRVNQINTRLIEKALTLIKSELETATTKLPFANDFLNRTCSAQEDKSPSAKMSLYGVGNGCY